MEQNSVNLIVIVRRDLISKNLARGFRSANQWLAAFFQPYAPRPLTWGVGYMRPSEVRCILNFYFTSHPLQLSHL